MFHSKKFLGTACGCRETVEKGEWHDDLDEKELDGTSRRRDVPTVEYAKRPDSTRTCWNTNALLLLMVVMTSMVVMDRTTFVE